MDPTLDKVLLENLHFDPDNPRLPQKHVGAAEPDVLQYLLLETNLIELMLSIGEQNFFIGEPLLVAPNSGGNGYIVVEGNRRLGALKLLSSTGDAPVMPMQVRQAREGAKYKPTTIPVLVFQNRNEILSYLGYRHITGVKEWSALAKARYLRQLRTRYGPDHTFAHKALAKEIGSKSPYVAKLLTGLTLVERARDSGALARLKMQEDDIAFSLLTTGIGYENISKFIGLNGAADVDAATLKDEELEELFGWVFGKPFGSATTLGESRNFDKLARVVGNDRALIELRRGVPLESADLFTSGPLETIRKIMLEVELRLGSAQATMSVAEGLDANDVAQADRLRKAASALHSSIHGAVHPVN